VDLFFFSGVWPSSSCDEDEDVVDDQKDRDGCVGVEKCEFDG
jgi:hypothetical protein